MMQKEKKVQGAATAATNNSSKTFGDKTINLKIISYIGYAMTVSYVDEQ